MKLAALLLAALALSSCTTESQKRLEAAALDGLSGAAEGYAAGGKDGALKAGANAFAAGLRPPVAQK